MSKRFFTFCPQPDVRTRALLRLALVASAFAAFVLLGCALITPLPPLSYTFLDDPQPALAPGQSRNFVVKVHDNQNQQPAAYSRFEVTSARYSQNNGYQTTKLATLQTNAQGELRFPFTMPVDATAADAITLFFHPLDEAGAGDYQQMIGVLIGLTLRFEQWPNGVYQGAKVPLEAIILDNRTQQPAAGLVVTVTQRFNKQQRGWPSDLQEVAIARTDTRGRLRIDYQTPAELKADDQIELQFTLNDGSEARQYAQYLYIQPSLAIELLSAPSALMRGSKTELLLRIHDLVQRRPLPQASVTAWQRDQQLFSGISDDQGLLRLPLGLPADYQPSEFELTLITDHGSLQAQLRQNFMVTDAPANLLLTTDKPVYQPGQVIHTRTLLLNALTLKAAAGAPIRLELRDPRGNRIATRQLTTSQYGIASADLELDSQALTGDYTLHAINASGNSYARTVIVKPYRLPRFKLEFSQDRRFFRPGEAASGELVATYFFGKPVVNGKVTIKGYVDQPTGNPTNAAETRRELLSATGATDAQGRYPYTLNLPADLANQLRDHRLTIDLEIQVIDRADHAETSEESLTVADQPLLLEVIAESGKLRRGVENIVYLQVSHPDGAGASATVDIIAGEDKTTVQTDQYGVAIVRVTPPLKGRFYLTLRAQRLQDPENAAPVEQTLYLPGEQGQAALLLRPTQAEIQSGQPFVLELLVNNPQAAHQPSQVLLQVYKGQQLQNSHLLLVDHGHATATLTLDPALVGTVELQALLLATNQQNQSANAYSGGYPSPGYSTGQFLAVDRRLLLVNPAPAQVIIQPDAEEYRPGDTAHFTIQTSRNGAPLQGALGISMVDESVFALGAQDPGFARTYFLVAKELLQPRYGIHGFAPFDGEASPYYFGDRYAAVPAQAVALAATRQNALFGLLAQELAITQSAQAATVHTATSAVSGLPGLSANGLSSFFLILLIGATVYGVRRSPGQTAAVIIVLCIVGLLWTACAPAAPAAPAAGDSGPMPAPPPASAPADGDQSSLPIAARPRLRQYFPETLFWLPELETDAAGRAQIAIPLADSITTWRVSVVVSDKEGNLGSAQLPLRAFQGFFVEPTLPDALSLGDEIDVPVSVYNYLDKTQSIQLAVEPASWFELRGQNNLSVTVAANEVIVAYLPIRITGVGEGEFALTATGDAMSDAIVRQVAVAYNAETQSIVSSGQLTGDFTYLIPASTAAISDSTRVTVKLYPDLGSQLLGGVRGLLRQPTGCFEQTSSVNYVNVLLLDYLMASGRVTPALQARAQRLVELGYQRLLTFEVQPTDPGGFSFYGYPAPDLRLTAYALIQLTAMGNQVEVDPALVGRITSYLQQSQLNDGSWLNHPASTAYITWALTDAGITPNAKVYSYLAKQLEAPLEPYTLVMVANALIGPAAEQATNKITAQSALDRLATLAQRDERGHLYWPAGEPTWLGSYGTYADSSTTALAAIAFLRTGQHLDLAQAALDTLRSQRDANGSFYTTETTALTLKAFTLAAQRYQQTGAAQLSLQLDNDQPQTITVDEQTAAEVIEVSFGPLAAGDHALAVTLVGTRTVPYQIVTEYQLPWSEVAMQAAAHPTPLQIAVRYGTLQVQLNDTVETVATISATQTFPNAVIAELGLPPGFTPMAGDLATLVESTLIDAYEVRSDKIVLYLAGLEQGQTYQFPYRLQARIPGQIQTPPSLVYAYYTPEQRDVEAPQWITVR